jgi:hypothetical protein
MYHAYGRCIAPVAAQALRLRIGVHPPGQGCIRPGYPPSGVRRVPRVPLGHAALSRGRGYVQHCQQLTRRNAAARIIVVWWVWQEVCRPGSVRVCSRATASTSTTAPFCRMCYNVISRIG